jgi:hypothetical protein
MFNFICLHVCLYGHGLGCNNGCKLVLIDVIMGVHMGVIHMMLWYGIVDNHGDGWG